ncbi:MAG TPA: class I mannose-6-phosphate isomerase, partial [Deinococcales bacterium]|nr:class I mannose-6-phosphate isomerase [Deinococcales bacterium]
GEFAGKTLHELVQEHPDEVVGQGWRGPHFPLLEKFLDASHPLPVHLHGDNATAARKYGEPNGKSEAWHILWAKEGASILAGVKPGLSRDELYAAFKAQQYDRVMPRYEIRSGDTVYVPGGVIHSFGPDTLIFEVQQTSDLSQSVMPTDVYGKTLSPEQWETNIQNTLDELRTDFLPRPNAGLEVTEGGNKRVYGCAGPLFALERWTLTEPHTEPARPRRCTTVSCVQGAVNLKYAGGVERVQSGESVVLPAALGEVTFQPEGTASLVVCYVPDLNEDVIQPLLAAGHSREQINTLGEVNA